MGNGRIDGNLIVTGGIDPRWVLFEPQTTTPVADRGRAYYDDGDDELYVYDGSAWQPLIGGGISQINAGTGIIVTNNTGPTTTVTADIGPGANQVAAGNHHHDATYVNEGQANSITSGMIVDGDVSADDIGPNIVSSIDGVTNDGGNIDLVAGSNITITPDDQNNMITIAATGLGIPSGVIVMWSGSIANIPAGWALCDGTNGTPNLRDRFIVGAGNTYNPGDTGGEAFHRLTIAEMPRHEHSYNIGKGGDYAGNVHKCPDYQAKYWTDPAGGDEPHENRPPYYALAYIMKL